MRTATGTVTLLLLASIATAAPFATMNPARVIHMQTPGDLQVWVADSLDNIMRDAQPPESGSDTVVLEAARNEYESAQIVVRSDEAITDLRAICGDLIGPEGAQIPADNCRCRFVGYIQVNSNSAATTPENLVAPAPGMFPDLLLEDEAVDVEKGDAQPVWLTVRVPADAQPGEYAGTVQLQFDGGGESIPVRLTVWPFTVPDERHLLFTNWFAGGPLARRYGVKLYSDEFWPIFEKYVANCAAHRQNILWVSPDTIRGTRAADGALTFDFTIFDRWVEILEKHGVADRIEISPLGGHASGWGGSDIALRGISVLDEATGKSVSLSAEEGLPHMLRALQEHLRDRGWLDKTLLHIADEPAIHHLADWRKKSDWVHSFAPEIKRIDAIEAPDFKDSLEVWVPKLNHYVNWQDTYERARDDGAELWFYTCCHPMNRFPNRYVDFPLIGTRVLHWVNWRYDLVGYLHWGLIAWSHDPFESAHRGNLPPGDAWIVYPGKEGPMDSIRWEALRDGIEDYEYLWLLTSTAEEVKARLGDAAADFNPRQYSDELCYEVVPNVLDYTRDADTLRDMRRRVAEDIVTLTEGPALLVWTDPPTSRSVAGPPGCAVLYVAAEPGTSITVDGKEVALDDRGFYGQHIMMGIGTKELRVTATRDGKTKAVSRVLHGIN